MGNRECKIERMENILMYFCISTMWLLANFSTTMAYFLIKYTTYSEIYTNIGVAAVTLVMVLGTGFIMRHYGLKIRGFFVGMVIITIFILTNMLMIGYGFDFKEVYKSVASFIGNSQSLILLQHIIRIFLMQITLTIVNFIIIKNKGKMVGN